MSWRWGLYSECTVAHRRQKRMGGQLGQAKTHTATNLLQIPFVQKVCTADLHEKITMFAQLPLGRRVMQTILCKCSMPSGSRPRAHEPRPCQNASEKQSLGLSAAHQHSRVRAPLGAALLHGSSLVAALHSRRASGRRAWGGAGFVLLRAGARHEERPHLALAAAAAGSFQVTYFARAGALPLEFRLILTILVHV